MKKNDVVTLDITAVSAEGYGIGRVDNTIVFVPFTAPGDRAQVIIVKVKKSFCFGRISKLISRSGDRIEPDCAAFSRCGGCAFRHISYDSERQIKRRRVIDCMTRIAGLDMAVREVESDENTDGYRNKAQYPVGADDFGITSGFYALHSHRIVECERCRLLPERFDKIRAAVLRFMKRSRVKPYNEQNGRGVLRHIYMRASAYSGEIMVCAVINADSLPDEQEFVRAVREADENIGTVALNINKNRSNVILGRQTRVLFGSGYITDRLCGLDFRVGVNSFFQVNRDMAQRLYQKACELARPAGKTVLDLYCGTGTIGLTMASEAKKIIGVEIVEQAVVDARFNAKLNKVSNAEFICDTAANAAKILFESGESADVVIVDPPRKGLDAQLIDTIAGGFAPERVVYISCDPATLARDLKLFSEHGYKAGEVFPFDLFPRTPHVECVCALTRRGNLQTSGDV